MDIAAADTPPPAAPPKGKGPANGFVMKLCDMVNGAPDDVVSWVPSGEAFRICSLARLEAETLPRYFRHSRFQSLVRQLNFYNFRKINRERTFWVYYHPLFHRDRPEEMHQLRRRTCPGFDGRRNRADPPPSHPPPLPSITWSNQDETVRHHCPAGGPDLPSGARVEVSRSPSPYGSPPRPPGGGGGSVFPGAGTGAGAAQQQPVRLVSMTSLSVSPDHGLAERQKGVYHASISDLEMHEYRLPALAAAAPPDAPAPVEGGAVAPPAPPLAPAPEAAPEAVPPAFAKKPRRAKPPPGAAAAPAPGADAPAHPPPSPRKPDPKQEARERQAHLRAVADVAGRLAGVVAEHAADAAARRPRRGKGRGRPDPPAAGRAGPAFGLEKPHDHYYGAGKCDLFTYDCDDGFVVDDRDDRRRERGAGPAARAPEAPGAPPCPCPRAARELAEAVLAGRPVGTGGARDRALAAAVLAFCLATHPRDPRLAAKVSAHLRLGPALAREFAAYCDAMTPGTRATGGTLSAAADLAQDWKVFAANLLRRVALRGDGGGRLGAKEREALGRCVASWNFETGGGGG